MQKFANVMIVCGLVLALLGGALPAAAQTGQAMVRVVHASPDAPAVDIYVDGARAFANAAFKAATNYANLTPGRHEVKVFPTSANGQGTPAISANPDLPAGAYTIVAVNKLANIEPLVLTDNLARPAAGKAHVRFVHASPDAPAVDIAVKGGPVLFPNVAFKGFSQFTPVDAATYDLEVRLAGTNTVALAVPGVALKDGDIVTVFAMGLAAGQPALAAVPVAYAAAAAPTTMPSTGADPITLATLAVVAGLTIAAAGLTLRRRAL
jgi:hypothetical protein